MATIQELSAAMRRMADLAKIAKVMKAMQTIKAGDTSEYQPGGNTGGGSSGGAGAAPVSTLAGLPQSELLQTLTENGLIKEGMPQEQALAILKFAQLREGVPINVAELMKLVNSDYASTSGDILGAGQDWMQKLMGTAYDPKDPNARMFADDPIFSTYAGGMSQLDETSDLNQASDLAWFRKNQTAQEQYYNDMMTAISTGALPIGAAANGSGGGGGGGGGGYGGGGGGGGGNGGEGEFGDLQTRMTAEQQAATTTGAKYYENFPGFRSEFLANVPQIAAQYGITDPALVADMMDRAEQLINIEGSKPQDVLRALEEEMLSLDTQTGAYEDIEASNATWLPKAAGEWNRSLQRFEELTGQQMGDDPSTEAIERWYVQPGDNPETDDVETDWLPPLSMNLLSDADAEEAATLREFLEPALDEATGGQMGSPAGVSMLINQLGYIKDLINNNRAEQADQGEGSGDGFNAGEEAGMSTISDTLTGMNAIPNAAMQQLAQAAQQAVTPSQPSIAEVMSAPQSVINRANTNPFTGRYWDFPNPAVPTTTQPPAPVTATPPTTVPDTGTIPQPTTSYTLPQSTPPPYTLPEAPPPPPYTLPEAPPPTIEEEIARIFPGGTGPINSENYGGGPRTPNMRDLLIEQIAARGQQQTGYPNRQAWEAANPNPTAGYPNRQAWEAANPNPTAPPTGGLSDQFQEGDPLTDVLSQPGGGEGSIINTTEGEGTFWDRMVGRIPDWFPGDQGNIPIGGAGQSPAFGPIMAKRISGMLQRVDEPGQPNPADTVSQALLSPQLQALANAALTARSSNPQTAAEDRLRRVEAMENQLEDWGADQGDYEEFAAGNFNPLTGMAINPGTIGQEYKNRLFVDPETGMLTGAALGATQNRSYGNLLNRYPNYTPEQLANVPNEGQFYQPQDMSDEDYNKARLFSHLIPQIQHFVNYGEGDPTGYQGNPDATFGQVYNTMNETTKDSQTHRNQQTAYTAPNPNDPSGYWSPEEAPFDEIAPLDLYDPVVQEESAPYDINLGLPGASGQSPALGPIISRNIQRRITDPISNLLNQNAQRMQVPATVQKPIPYSSNRSEGRGRPSNYGGGVKRQVSQPANNVANAVRGIRTLANVLRRFK